MLDPNNIVINTYFLIIPPGLEKISTTELIQKAQQLNLSLQNLKQIVGGLEFDCEYPRGLILNHFLKLPNRLLIRIDHFKCRDFPKLFNKIKKINWSPYLINDTKKQIEVKASSRSSRLIHTGKIIETCQAALNSYFKGNPAKEKTLAAFEKLALAPPSLYIRIENDECTVSVDTSGERLGKRGMKPYSSIAPLRENLAAAMAFCCIDLLAKKKNITILDPMCGSGTLLLEANTLNSTVTGRIFSYQGFPFIINRGTIDLPSLPATYHIKQTMGLDIDPNVLIHAKKNTQLSALEHISFKLEDLSEAKKNEINPDIVITNPPYGMRVKLESSLKNAMINENLPLIIAQKYTPKILGVLLPKQSSLKIPPGYSKIKPSLEFSNGGIPVRFFVFKKN